MIRGIETAFKKDLPLITLHLLIPGGSASDPAGLEGLSHLTASLLRRGTRKKSRRQLLDALDACGASLTIHCAKDFVSLRGEVLQKRLQPFLGLLCEVLCEPAFAEEELHKARQELIGQLALAREDDQSLLFLALWPTFYGARHPYGHSTLGTAESLLRIGKTHVERHYSDLVRRAGWSLGVAGCATAQLVRDSIAPALRPLLGRRGAARQARPPAAPRRGRRGLLIEKPERSQHQLLLATPAVAAKDPAFLPLHIANTAFGGTFRSQLSEELRDRRGLTYHVSSSLPELRAQAPLYLHAFFDRPRSAEGLRRMHQLLLQFMRNGLPQRDLAHARQYLSHSLPFLTDLPEKEIALHLCGRLFGRPRDFLRRYSQSIERAHRETIRRTIQSTLCADELLAIAVADADDWTELRRALPAVETWQCVPYHEIGETWSEQI